MAYLKLAKPDWLKQHPDDKLHQIFQSGNRIFQEGTVVWGHVIQANAAMFEDGDEDCPGELLFSLEDPRKVDCRELQNLAGKIYSLKGTTSDHPELARIGDYLTDEFIRVFGLEVPRVLSPNLKYHISTTLFLRKHLPNGRLSSSLMPIVVTRSEPMIALPLPERFWSESLKEQWGPKNVVRSTDSEMDNDDQKHRQSTNTNSYINHLPFGPSFNDLFSGGAYVWLKILGGAVVTSIIVAFKAIPILAENGIELSKNPAVIAGVVAGSASVGAVLGGLLSLKDVVQTRLAHGKPVSFALKLLFGFGLKSLLFVWFPLAIVVTFVATILTFSL